MAIVFDDSEKFDAKLKEAARVAVQDVLGVKKDEEVLIITNPDRDVRLISEAVYDAVVGAGGRASLIMQQMKTQMDFAEPSVLKALASNPTIGISISKEKLGKDAGAMKEPIIVGEKKYNHIFNYLLGEKKMRSFWSPSIDLRMFMETVPIDYTQLRGDCARVAEALDWADEVHVAAPGGTDLMIGVQNRISKKDDGNFQEPGSGGNLPCGEVFISPALGSSQGVIAYDGSISSDKGEIMIEQPIVCTVQDNRVIKIEGGREAEELLGTITRGEQKPLEMAENGDLPKDAAEVYKINARNLGELGIGLNRSANIVGNMLEDEKVYRTCHIAIGSNYDDDAEAMIHLDGLIKNPTITCIKGAEKKVIMQDGELTI
ncbi:MAG: aminopeptidase [Candidatus Thermoplasmatota archaeon]|nr:aminopeptidase [Candidatus Thermoplasmatota archaeon]